jgi:DNA repair exonuclease SbcCD ATPase subunit
MPQNDTISRIRSLTIRDVRGFGGEHTLNLDADIVLLNGSNGFGKTSLIDCLNLLLNGRDPRITADLGFRGSQQGEIRARALCLGNPEERECSFSIDQGRIGTRAGEELNEALCSLASVFYQHDIESYLAGEEGAASPLYQFLCPGSPERLIARNLLAQAKSELESNKARRVVPEVASQDAIHARRRKVAAELKEAWRQADFLPSLPDEELQLPENYIDHLSWERPLRRLVRRLREEIREDASALECLQKLQQYFAGLKLTLGLRGPQDAAEGRLSPGVLLLQSTWEAFGPDELFFVSGPGRPVERRETLVLTLDGQSEETEDLFLKDLRRELDEVEGEIESLRAYSRHFTGESSDLEQVMEALASFGESWAEFPSPSPLKTPPSFLERLSQWLRHSSRTLTQGAPSLLEAFRSWRADLSSRLVSLQEQATLLRRNLHRKEMSLTISRALRAIETKAVTDHLVHNLQSLGQIRASDLRARIEPALSGLEVRGVLAELDRISNSLQSWIEVEQAQRRREIAITSSSGSQASVAILDQALRAIREERSQSGILDTALEVPPEHLKSLEDRINQLLSRFRCVDGMLPISLEGKKRIGWNHVTRNGVGYHSLSTGQRALVAVAVTLSLNLLFEHLLPHRLILLDDVTTSLDMAQLTRAAILFRQFAYGSGLEPGESRRQLILSSHHEDLTNRLLDFLMPPPGRSLKVVQFQGWSPQRGPTLAVFKMDGEKESSDRRNAFKARLRSAFEERLEYLFSQ